jgi:hypothetical protein
MTGNTTHLSILTLNVYGLSYPIERHRTAHWIKKQDKPFIAYKERISLRKTNSGLD